MSSIWIEWGKAAIDLVKVAAWPGVVVFLAWKFGSELSGVLSSLLSRKFEVEGPGFKAKVDAAEQQQQGAENPAIKKLPETPLLGPSSRPAVARIENEMRAELKAVEPEKWSEVLLRDLAQARLERGHEYIYNRIFGSQIGFLKRLNEVPRLTVDQAREFFKPYADQFPQVYSEYGFDGWLHFLTVSALVERKGDDLEIGEIGRDFLVYIINQRLSESKPW
jgi:hypothetical protein